MNTKPKPSLDDLTDEQREALLKFKKDHGHTWKYKLNSAWQTGTDANMTGGHLLRQIRNQLGPQWLERLTIPK